MLDVHAPEHPIHGIREFLLHLFTITVGLLIALGLENLAEWRHHVHIRHEAEANIRREIEANQKDVRSLLAAIPREQKDLTLVKTYLSSIAGHHPMDLHRLNMGLTEATLQDASWATASATGALSLMEYSEVQRFAGAYQLQKKLDSLQDAALPEIIDIEAAMGTGDPAKMSADDLAATSHSVTRLMAHIETVREMAVSLDKSYSEALQTE